MEDETIDQQPSIYIGYKIQAGKEYIVNRHDYNGKAFYSITISKKNIDNTKEFAKKQITFKGNPDLKDKTKIKILKGFEDFYFKSEDTKHYNPIFKLCILDFEITESPNIEEEEIKEAYNSLIDKNDNTELPF